MTDKFTKTQETMEEAIKLLNENGKCLIVRPTGFGKTFILAHIVPLYEHVIYFYPTDIIHLDVKEKYKAVLKGSDITFVTYAMMTSIWKNKKIKTCEEFKNISNDSNTLFIFDEAHLTGGAKISQALDALLEEYSKCHVLGATATPERSDYFNVRYHFFDGIECSKYTMIDAINDGLFPKPFYIYSTFEIHRNFENLGKTVEDADISEERKTKLTKMIKSSEMKYVNLYNEVEVIKTNINLSGHDTSYMKYISFFPDRKTMYSKIDQIKNNFHQIYPKHTIREIIVASDTTEHKKNVFKLQEMKKKKNTIDIVFCVDMLSLGYHVSDVNGIIMYRNTYSDIIYVQQLGRCISIDSEIEPLIFDFVGNYLKHADVLSNTVIGKKRNKNSNDIEVFGKDNVRMINNLREFTEIERLIETEIRAELEDAIIDAYLHKNAPIRYCLYELKLDSEEAFLELVESKKNEWEMVVNE